MKLSFNIKKVTKVQRKYKVIVIIFLGLMLFGASYLYLLAPQFDEKSRLVEDALAKKQELDRLTAIKNNIEKTRTEYERLKEAFQLVLRQMPEQKDVPNLLRQVSAIGQESRMRIRYFEPKEAQSKEFYTELPFELRYSGPYHSVGYFFDGVRKLDRIIHITNFSLESKMVGAKVVVEGSCLAKTYVYSKETPPKEKGKDQKEKEQKEKKDETVIKK